jgi:hypothetical protein
MHDHILHVVEFLEFMIRQTILKLRNWTYANEFVRPQVLLGIISGFLSLSGPTLEIINHSFQPRI